MAKKIKGFYKLFLSFLMALVGFSACSKHEKGEMLHLYGCPYEELKVSGTIVDKNNNPVPGVKVKIKNVYPGVYYNPYVSSMPISDEKGRINQEINETFEDYVQIVFEKVGNTDAAQKFKDDSLIVKKVVTSTKKKKNSLKTGEAKATFTLKLKDN